MDITDVEGDERARIRTLPVLFGPTVALMIASVFLAGAAASPLVLSVLPNVSIMCDVVDVYLFLSMRSDLCSTHTHTHTHTHTQTHTPTHTHTHTYTHTHTHTHTHTRTNTRTHAHTRTNTHTDTQTHSHTLSLSYTHTRRLRM